MRAPVSPAPVPLAVRDEGSGPTIVLLHGLAGDHTVWNGVIPLLARGHRVVAPDLRGHGRTPAPEQSRFTFAEMAADLEALLGRLGIERPHLVGLSAGGCLALLESLDHAERYRSLVLVAAPAQMNAHTRAILDRWREAYRDGGEDAYVLRLLKDLFYPDWIEAHLDFADRLRAQQRATDPRSTFGWGQAIREFDVRTRLGHLRLPTLVVQGMDDQVIDAAHARLLRQSIPGAELKLFARTGHLLPIERPDEIAELLVEWVDRVERTR